jgi:hypothetical protein
MKRKITYLPAEPVESVIVIVRGQKVILDTDLARIYGVQTKALNQAVKRNVERFPSDFVFQLTEAEALGVARLRSQIVTLNQEGLAADTQPVGVEEAVPNRSRIVTGSQKHRDPRFLPHAFTDQGAIMAATVLNSPQVVQMSVFIVRAFVKMRAVLVRNQARASKRVRLERKLTEGRHNHENVIVRILHELAELMNPPHRPVGFQVRERGRRANRV